MNDKNEIYKEINNLMKASNNFDIEGYEETLHDIEQRIGKEVSRKDEQQDEQKLVGIFIDEVLKAIDHERTINTMLTIGQLLAQAEAEYRGLKTKYMNEGVSFFIDYLEIEDAIEPIEPPEIHKEKDDGRPTK